MKSHGDMFDPGDWTTEQLKEHFPDEWEELDKIREERWKAFPEYYKVSSEENG